MKSIIEYINEAKANKSITSLPDNMKEWYDKCKNFCTAGAWNLTDPKLSTSDFDGFLEAVKEFDFTQIKGLGKRSLKAAETINALVKALIDKNTEEVKSVFNEFSSTVSGNYWFQSDLTRRDNGGYIAEAALIIAMSHYLDHGKNWWKNSDMTIDQIKNKL